MARRNVATSRSRKELIKMIERRGYTLARQKGSHAQFKKPGVGTITVPYTITKNIELSILRQLKLR